MAIRSRLTPFVLLGALGLGPSLAAQEAAVAVAAAGTRIRVGDKMARLLEPSEKEIQVKSLEYDANIGAPPDPGGDRANGGDYYVLILEPKEKLTIHLEAENSNRVGMIAIRPAVRDKMASQFERSERVPKTLRSHRFEMQNITDQPYTLMVLVYGTINHWYKLKIERKS